MVNQRDIVNRIADKTGLYKKDIKEMLLAFKEVIDTISVLLGKIATELYPDRFSYKNTVYYHKNRKQPARVIKFTVG